MSRRLLVGLLKGLVIGGAVGGGLHYGLGWPVASGFLGYLVAMGVGGTTGLLTGRPPWHQDAALEGVLKALAGVGVGALVYWLAGRYVAAPLPLELPQTPPGASWNHLPLLTSPLIAAVYGALVELDNTGNDTPAPKQKEAQESKGAPGDKAAKENLPKNRKRPETSVKDS